AGNLGHAVELLDKYLPPGRLTNPPADPRGWEWYHYKNGTRSSELFTLDQLSFTVTAMAADVKGRIATLTERGAVNLYDPNTRRKLSSMVLKYEDVLLGTEFSRMFFSRDNRFLVITARPNLYLLNAENFSLVKALQASTDDLIEGLDTSVDGSEL